ncbi:tetratricopeptide repeat protein [Alteromonas sp. 345S023]|uniref:Tetratricopeptide repeat protein n=1 Tax=Alteromonas profundi TaxID=2696062 RepID=A0A7X5LLP1_9ALTE|nr:tetratricopeptide repeat-containing sulfotransferase family protein [Alteromonas profundi]NDV91658.1 tetratricopeptide repeat protein [Alteromonas profundi]
MNATEFQQHIGKIKHAVQGSAFSNANQLLSQLKSKDLNASQHVEVLYLTAVTCRLSGDYLAASHHLNTLLNMRPDYGRAHQELAYNYDALNKPKEAASALFTATHYNPALISSWKKLLTVYRKHNDKDAEQLALQQLEYLESLPAPILGAYDLMYEKKLASAEQICRQFLLKNKHHPEAMLLLAELGIQLKVYHDAEFLLESCSTLYPDNLRAIITYLSLLAKLGKHQKVLEIAEMQRERFTDNLQIIMAKANALLGLNKTAEAIAIYDDLLAKEKDRPAVWLALGHAYKSKGKTDKAIFAYQQAAYYHPQFGDAYWSLANLKSYRFDDKEVSRMLELEQQPSIGLDDRIHVCFAIGKALEDMKRYDDAFSYYNRGNQFKLASVQFDITRTEQAVESQIAVSSKQDFNRESTGFPSPEPIFIVGMPRAGSTLLEQILASQGDIDGTMELHNILSLASSISNQQKPYPFCLNELTFEQRYNLGKQYIEQTKYYRGNAPFFIDKMPNNFMHIGFIKQILPNAKIIDARRDPMDCCFSNFKQLFGDGQEFSYGLEEIGRYFEAYAKLMRHWDKVYPGQILRVTHEEVLDDLALQVKRMLDYIGVPFDSACLDFYNTERLIKTPSAEQVRQPINRSGQDRWKPFEAHLSPLLKRFK